MTHLDKIGSFASAILREATNARQKIDVVRQALRDRNRWEDQELVEILDVAIESLDEITG